MVDRSWEDHDVADDEIEALLDASLEELPAADLPRRQEILKAISDLCWKVGPRAARVIPTLMAWPLVTDRETEDQVCYALHNCAPDSIPPLLNQLGHVSEFARRRACYTLGLVGEDLGDHRIPVADALLARLDDCSEDVRNRAALALGALRDCRTATVERLLEMARSTSSSDRSAALHAIGRIGHATDDENALSEPSPISGAAEIVLAGLDDADLQVRSSACYALEALRLPVGQHLERLLHIIESDPSADIRSAAARQLPRLAERADISAAAAKLAKYVAREHLIAWPVCEALAKIGRPARVALPALLEVLGSEDERLALEAAEAVWSIDPRADLILPTLDRLFDSNGEKVCDIICELGPDARPLLHRLLNALAQDENWDLQWAAADAIGFVASGDPQTMQALKNALVHESGIVRSAAANAFGRLGEPGVQLLMDMLRTEPDEQKLEWVAHALCRIGPTAVSAVPLLRPKLRSQRRGLRMWASIALANIASDADAVPSLIEILEDVELAEIWKLACDSLAAIGAPAAPSREILVALTTCPVDEIQKAAELAVDAIDRKVN